MGRAFGAVAFVAALAVVAPVRAADPPPAPVLPTGQWSPPDAGPLDPVEQRIDRGRKMLIAGGVVAGVGLLSAAIGFGTWGGIHAANPGDGLALESSDPEHAHRTLRLARGMEGLAYSGVALLLTGTIIAAIGGASYRKGLRARDARRVAFAPGLGSLTFFGRF